VSITNIEFPSFIIYIPNLSIGIIIMADPSLGEAQQPQPHDYSDEETKVLDAMEAEARRLFPPSSTVFYENIDTLKSAVQQWPNAKGAQLSHHSHKIACKRATAPPSFKKALVKARIKNKTPVENQRESKTQRCGCEFVIKYAEATPPAIKRGAAPEGSPLQRKMSGTCASR
jgi:hypothetical protein